MYISQFWCGVIVTIVAEILLIIGFAIQQTMKDKEKK
jgi:hypothetical protein